MGDVRTQRSGRDEGLLCDLCGGLDYRVVAEASEASHAIAVCESCGLVRAVEIAASFDIERFYRDRFDGDAGSAARLEDGNITARAIARQEKRALKSLALIEAHMTLSGQRVLDVRCRSGALAEAMATAGANVVAVDFFAANVAAAERRSAHIEAHRISPAADENLAFLDDASIDAVTALTVHVLGHLQSPARFVAALHRVLRPGGRLFLDEKNILRSAKLTTGSIFTTGKAHFHQFSPETLRRFLVRAGFEIVTLENDPRRRSSFRHITAIARKPIHATAIADDEDFDLAASLRALDRSQRNLARTRRFNAIERSLSRWWRHARS